jgi:hypothetical protein
LCDDIIGKDFKRKIPVKGDRFPYRNILNGDLPISDKFTDIFYSRHDEEFIREEVQSTSSILCLIYDDFRKMYGNHFYTTISLPVPFYDGYYFFQMYMIHREKRVKLFVENYQRTKSFTDIFTSTSGFKFATEDKELEAALNKPVQISVSLRLKGKSKLVDWEKKLMQKYNPPPPPPIDLFASFMPHEFWGTGEEDQMDVNNGVLSLPEYTIVSNVDEGTIECNSVPKRKRTN